MGQTTAATIAVPPMGTAASMIRQAMGLPLTSAVRPQPSHCSSSTQPSDSGTSAQRACFHKFWLEVASYHWRTSSATRGTAEALYICEQVIHACSSVTS